MFNVHVLDTKYPRSFWIETLCCQSTELDVGLQTSATVTVYHQYHRGHRHIGSTNRLVSACCPGVPVPSWPGTVVLGRRLSAHESPKPVHVDSTHQTH